jgi:hypothetical protein
MNINLNDNFILWILILIILPNGVISGIHQKRLLNYLFENYDASERPVENENEGLDVSINLSVQQIVDVDEKKQIIIFSGWLDMVFL